MEKLTIAVLEGTFAICRLDADATLPGWVGGGPLVSTTRTRDELSVVCPQDLVPKRTRCERGWRCLRVVGTLDFALVGVLAALVVPLAAAGVSVFAISTFDTDLLLVRESDLERAKEALRRAGHAI
jgi:hypothetical protein